MKTLFIVIGVIITVVLIIAAIVVVSALNIAHDVISSLVFEDIDMSEAADGTFEGAADAGLVSVKVAVTVEDQTISRIDILEHKNGKGASAEAITQDMTAANTYDVDIVSGATLSSETIKSAVSKALKASCTE